MESYDRVISSHRIIGLFNDTGIINEPLKRPYHRWPQDKSWHHIRIPCTSGGMFLKERV